VLLLAILDDQIVGSLLATFDGWRGNLYRLVVAPECRRQGIGRRLVREVEKIFENWGVRRTTVLIDVDRPWAAQFWSAVGYPRDEHIIRHVGIHSPTERQGDSAYPHHRPIVVIVSANAEWRPVRRLLNPESVEQTPYGECFTYPIANERVLFFQGGWGKVAAAASAEYAISRWQPEVLVNIGTCGGIAGRAERGEKLLVTRTIVYDIYEAMGDSSEAIRAYTTDIDLTWLDASFPVSVRQVPLLSGDRDLVPSQVAELGDRFDAVAGDWESGAIAYVANRRNTPVLIIRAVSDLVNAQTGDTIGALAVFEAAASTLMRDLLDDLTRLIPYALARRRVVEGA
jgi:adenosylhomocysteine nucleosidase